MDDERNSAAARDSRTEGDERGGALVWLWCSLVVVIVDQTTKIVAVALLDPTSSVKLFPTLDLVLAYNTGAAKQRAI